MLACNSSKEETLTQVFSCEFCEILRAPFSIEHLRWLLFKLFVMILITCDVPQGSILGPLLFLICVNDLQHVLKTLDPIMFADDTNLSRSSQQKCSMKKGVLRNFTKFTGKPVPGPLFLIKLQASGLQLYLKRDSGTGLQLY